MKKWIPALLIVVAVAMSLYSYSSLPDRMPTHWGFDGQPNGWSSRFWGAWLMPLMMALVWLVMRAIPHIDPRKENYEKFRGVYEILVSAILAFMLVMHFVVLKAATGGHVSIGKVVLIGVGALFVLIGSVLPRIQPNWFFGIRTPWTLTSDVSWERTHKVGGMVFVAFGLIAIVTSLVAPAASPWVMLIVGLILVVFLFAYSYRVWKDDPLKHSARGA